MAWSTAPLACLETMRQRTHFRSMTKRKSEAAKNFKKPAHWSDAPPPQPRASENDEELSPTRYGDWVKDGIAIDF